MPYRDYLMYTVLFPVYGDETKVNNPVSIQMVEKYLHSSAFLDQQSINATPSIKNTASSLPDLALKRGIKEQLKFLQFDDIKSFILQT